MRGSPRVIAWVSAGAASAVAWKLTPEAQGVYCETGAEHPDNERFLGEVERWCGSKVTRLRSDKYADTWDLWEKRRYLSGPDGAACTLQLKVIPRLDFQRPDDVHVFGYTADRADAARAKRLRDTYPELAIQTPLIDKGITKHACLAMVERAGIAPPVTYALGFPNANCLPCVKARSPRYWALVRQHFPAEFNRMAKMSRELGVKLCWLGEEKSFIDEIPEGHPTTDAIVPSCDFLCHIAEQDMA